jgi:hypothetical protein
MGEKKESTFQEFIKCNLIVLMPIAISKDILKSLDVNILVRTFLIPVTLLILVGILRRRIKEADNNDLPIILMIIIFFPAGLYYLWRYSKRNYIVRSVVTGIVVALLIIVKKFIESL